MGKKSKETYPGQRGKEKRELYKKFRHRAIEDLFKNKLFALFNHKCFKCGALERPSKIVGHPPILCIDHHIPMALGGHLQLGNLVALCRICNGAKLDLHPEKFYTPQELENLKSLLAQQQGLFDFEFDWELWHSNPSAYLISLGVGKELVHELMSNPDHPDYIGSSYLQTGVSISFDTNSGVYVP